MIIEIDQLVNQITSLQKKSAENDLKVFKEFFDASLWRLEELKKERAIFNGKKKDLIDFLAVKIRSIKYPNKILTFESHSFFWNRRSRHFVICVISSNIWRPSAARLIGLLTNINESRGFIHRILLLDLVKIL